MSTDREPRLRAEPVLQWLYRRYYLERGPVAEASSHWREFSRRFRVVVDPGGKLVEVQGYGFGDPGGASAAHRALGLLGALAQVVARRRVSLMGAAVRGIRVVHQMGLGYTQDSVRQVCTLDLLQRFIDEGALGGEEPRRVLVIGDGYGTFSALLKARYPSVTITLVDLGPTLFFQAYHLGRAFPALRHRSVDEAARAGAQSYDFLYCPAEDRDRVPRQELDLAVNVASMQEMTPEAVAQYFRYLRERKTRLLYCCNRLRKVLPGGEVLEFMNYPWQPADVHLVDEPCPWHQWYIGGGSGGRARALGVPLPFVRVYDGLHWHRLTRLAAAL